MKFNGISFTGLLENNALLLLISTLLLSITTIVAISCQVVAHLGKQKNRFRDKALRSERRDGGS